MIGRLILVSNPNMISNIVRSGPTQLISIDETNTYGQDVLCGSILLPPFSIMNELVDGRLDLNIIENQYFNYLHTAEPLAFISGILAIMFKGVNVAIMVERYDNEFSVIPKMIWNFMNVRYGIVPETVSSGFVFPTDPMYLDTIYSDLFLHDYIDDTLLKVKHSPYPYNRDVQTKLMNLYNLRAAHNLAQGNVVDPFINMR